MENSMENEQRDKSKRLRQMINAAEKICILGHVRPDGDCVGSTLAVYNYIISNTEGKTVDVYLETFSADMKFLSGAKKVKHEAQGKRYDLAISIDVSEIERLGKFKDMFLSAISTVCIDHHVSNPGFGDLCYVDPGASSACEAFADLIDMDKVNLDTATCLYLGMVHDTGVFKYSSTRRHTMELAGLLLDKGVNSAYIIDETFYKKTYKQNLLMAKTILESVLYEDGKVIYGHVSKDTFKEFKANNLDTEGIVEQLRLTEGVEVAIFSYQLTKKNVKFSLRSKSYVDVNKIATAFGGGGHVRAAGIDMNGDPGKLLKPILEEVRKQLK